EGGLVNMIAFGRSEDDLLDVLRHPQTLVGSDGLAVDPHGLREVDRGLWLIRRRLRGDWRRVARSAISAEVHRLVRAAWPLLPGSSCTAHRIQAPSAAVSHDRRGRPAGSPA